MVYNFRITYKLLRFFVKLKLFPLLPINTCILSVLLLLHHKLTFNTLIRFTTCLTFTKVKQTTLIHDLNIQKYLFMYTLQVKFLVKNALLSLKLCILKINFNSNWYFLDTHSLLSTKFLFMLKACTIKNIQVFYLKTKNRLFLS